MAETIRYTLWDTPAARRVLGHTRALSCAYEGSEWKIILRTREHAVTARSEDLEHGVRKAILLMHEKLDNDYVLLEDGRHVHA